MHTINCLVRSPIIYSIFWRTINDSLIELTVIIRWLIYGFSRTGAPWALTLKIERYCVHQIAARDVELRLKQAIVISGHRANTPVLLIDTATSKSINSKIKCSALCPQQAPRNAVLAHRIAGGTSDHDAHRPTTMVPICRTETILSLTKYYVVIVFNRLASHRLSFDTKSTTFNVRQKATHTKCNK